MLLVNRISIANFLREVGQIQFSLTQNIVPLIKNKIRTLNKYSKVQGPRHLTIVRKDK